jgi:hypothetical protein
LITPEALLRVTEVVNDCSKVAEEIRDDRKRGSYALNGMFAERIKMIESK